MNDLSLSSKDVNYSLDSRGGKRSCLSPATSEKNVASFQRKSSNTHEISEKKVSQCTFFRNVSACSRCRARKNRCDQHLPSCASCEKVGEKCVGYDPITRKEIPRSYVFYLENRVTYLENLLRGHNIEFATADVLDYSSNVARIDSPSNSGQNISEKKLTSSPSKFKLHSHKLASEPASSNKKKSEPGKTGIQISEVDNYATINKQSRISSRNLQMKSGMSFARVVLAAVKSSVPGPSHDKKFSSKPPPTAPKPTSTSIRDSFFGLHSKCTSEQARFPSKKTGYRLVKYYFEYANPQLPILHRGEFMKMFESVYSNNNAAERTPNELYMLNIVFATGAGILLGDNDGEEKRSVEFYHKNDIDHQSQPEEYHAAAIAHMESCLNTSSGFSCNDCFGGGLEQLQAVLLLAGFALLRPVPPGLWYIIGAAVRLAVDLGLHNEDGINLGTSFENMSDFFRKEDQSLPQMQHDERNLGGHKRREWVRDFRRRLWWCTYSFDRLVSTCVGRPVGITDQVITTQFPSLLDDIHITPTGFFPPPDSNTPSYKHVSYHYFRLRILQSEILQVLQYRQAIQTRAACTSQKDQYKINSPPSSFLSAHSNDFGAWREDIDRRLWEWKTSVPSKNEIGVSFIIEYLDLNYWQCILMLYRQSLGVPKVFAEMFGTGDKIEAFPKRVDDEKNREEDERIFLKIAEAGQMVLSLYHQLSCMHFVNYTYLATHHIIMAGISYLFAIWHSVLVRSRLTTDEVNSTILAATSVLGNLVVKCPPADACRDALERMSKFTVKMCLSTTGFGNSVLCFDSRSKTRRIVSEHKELSEGTKKYGMRKLPEVSAVDNENNEINPKTITHDSMRDNYLRNPKLNFGPASALEAQSYREGKLESSDFPFIVSHDSRHKFKASDGITNQTVCPRSMNTNSECAHTSSLSDLNFLLDPSFTNSHSNRNARDDGHAQPVSIYNPSNLHLKPEYSSPEECSVEGLTWSGDIDVGDSLYDGSDLNYEVDGKGIGGIIPMHDFNQTGSVSDLFEGFFGGGSGFY